MVFGKNKKPPQKTTPTQMDVGQNPPPLLANTAESNSPEDKYRLGYELFVKSKLEGRPGDKEIWLADTMNGNKLAFMAKDKDGKIIQEDLDVSKLTALTSNLTNNKLTQDKVNLNKKLLLEAFRAQLADRLFKNAQELAREAALEKEQDRLNKESKKRRKELEGKNSRPEPVPSNMEAMKHLVNMSMEGLATKMVIDELVFILKMICFTQYIADNIAYKNILGSENGAQLVLDLSKSPNDATGPTPEKPLYAFKFVGDKIKLDTTKPLEVRNGKIVGEHKPRKSNGSSYPDYMIIMANGYYPPPTLLRSLMKEFAQYILLQVEADVAPEDKMFESHLFREQEKDKDKDKKSKKHGREDDPELDALTVRNAMRPKPTPGGK